MSAELDLEDCASVSELAMDELRSMRAENMALHEKVAALESREVCTVAHDNVEECGYCQRDELSKMLHLASLSQTRLSAERDQWAQALSNLRARASTCLASKPTSGMMRVTLEKISS